jgi:hypothetical protein
LTTTSSAVVASFAPSPGYTLQSNTNLATTAWSGVTNAVNVVGSESQFIIAPWPGVNMTVGPIRKADMGCLGGEESRNLHITTGLCDRYHAMRGYVVSPPEARVGFQLSPSWAFSLSFSS